MSVKNWKFYYKKTEHESFFEKVINTIVLWMGLGLIWMSFWSIIGEKYPEFVPGNGVYFIIVPWMFLLWLFYEVLFPRLGQDKKAFKWLVPSINAIVFLGYFIKTRTTLLTGFLSVGNQYMTDYNRYYGTSYYVSGGKTENKVVAFTFAVFVFWFLLWNVAYILKKKWILMIFPLSIILLQLVVGFSPAGTGVEGFFIAALLMCSLGMVDRTLGQVSTGNVKKNQFALQKTFVKGAVVFLVLLSLLLSNLFYKDEMNQLITKKQDLLALQDKIFSQKVQMDILSMVDLQFDKEILDNSEPRYTGRQVLTITVDKKPHFSMYLKGYNGTIYEEAVWTGDYSEFLETCQRKGEQPEDVAKVLFQRGFRQMRGQDASVLHYSIKYNTTIGNVAYVPYFSDYDSLDEAYAIAGDYLLEKKITDNTVSGTCLNRPGSNSQGQYELLWAQDDFSLGKYSWYEDMVEKAYLEVPKELEKVFDKLRIREIINTDECLSGAAKVKEYLAANMSYNLKLEELPSGRDPIEYFLTESHEGYCMHFASAGTMLLRYLGFPARYVSGYVIPSSAFVDTEVGYIGIARDRNAHAWVEIYVDGLGWIPVEMTPGYDSQAERLPTQTEKETESETESESVSTQAGATQEPQTETEKPTESEKSSQSSESESQTQGGGTEEQGDIGGVDETAGVREILDAFFRKLGTSLAEVLGGLAIILTILTVFILSYIGYKRWLMYYHAVLERAIKRKRTRYAVKRMHRRLYGYIRIRKHILKGLRDNELEALLVETFTQVSEEDWRRHMEIAKKMHYSKEEISEEEMMHCYDCYKEASDAFFKK